MDLEKDILEQFTDETGNVVGPTDEQLEPYTFEKQKDDLSETLGGANAVKKFFDFMSMRVFLPWLRTLTVAFNRLKGDAKSSVAELEKKVGKGYDSIDERVQTIERDVLTPAEEATANAQRAADRAVAAADGVQNKDQVGSVLDVVQLKPLHFGSGTTKEINDAIPTLSGNSLLFDKEDTSWDDLLEEVENKAPRALVDGTYDCATEEEIENVLKAVYADMPSASVKHIVIKLSLGDQAPVYFDNGIIFFTLFKGFWSGGNGSVEARTPQYYDTVVLRRNIFDGVWKDWEWVEPMTILGREYRTTERCQGLPVYTKMIYAGTPPVKGIVAYEHGIEGIAHVIRYNGWIVAPNEKNYHGVALPYFDPGSGSTNKICEITANHIKIGIASTIDLWTDAAVWVQLWYTKGSML